MKPTVLALLAFMLSLPATANETQLTPETITRIEAVLADMNCQMDPDDIEAEDDGYDLDDVICEGGQQFDIKLDTALNEVSRRAE